MNKQEIDETAAKVGREVLRHLDRAIYEVFETATDFYLPKGADELGRALFTNCAYSTHGTIPEPTDLPIHGDPSVWGSQIKPDIDTNFDPGIPPDATPGRDVEVGPEILPPDPGSGVGPVHRLEPPTIDQEATMPDKSFIQEVTDFAAAGRDEIVTALENPMQGFTAPEPEPEGPEPEPEPDLEPDWD